MDLQIDLEQSVITQTDTVIYPRTVVVKSIDANLALVTMLCKFVSHLNTLEANHLMAVALQELHDLDFPVLTVQLLYISAPRIRAYQNQVQTQTQHQERSNHHINFRHLLLRPPTHHILKHSIMKYHDSPIEHQDILPLATFPELRRQCKAFSIMKWVVPSQTSVLTFVM